MISSMSQKECEYQEICPTTNFWIEEKKAFIASTCKTRDCILCTLRISFKTQKIEKGTEEWNRIVRFFLERRKQFPPYGLIKLHRR